VLIATPNRSAKTPRACSTTTPTLKSSDIDQTPFSSNVALLTGGGVSASKPLHHPPHRNETSIQWNQLRRRPTREVGCWRRRR
jgi:hypothetical protein